MNVPQHRLVDWYFICVIAGSISTPLSLGHTLSGIFLGLRDGPLAHQNKNCPPEFRRKGPFPPPLSLIFLKHDKEEMALGKWPHVFAKGPVSIKTSEAFDTSNIFQGRSLHSIATPDGLLRAPVILLVSVIVSVPVSYLCCLLSMNSRKVLDE